MPASAKPAGPSAPRWLDSALRAAADTLDRPVQWRAADGTVLWRNAAAQGRGGGGDADGPTPVLADYARLFGLVGDDAALLPALAGPRSLAALARELHVADSTLRRRVRRICEQTGLPDAAALRRELRGLPPLRA
jgi:hypothetical protein